MLVQVILDHELRQVPDNLAARRHLVTTGSRHCPPVKHSSPSTHDTAVR